MDGVRTACDKVRRLAMQWAMVGGEAFLKPVILQNGGLSWQVIRRDHWSVLGKLPDGQITDMATCEKLPTGSITRWWSGARRGRTAA